ncbi:MAG TPA: Stp1/IreP family PP2C-type Ser/Thr phosphatase, partial [Candidatus Binatia bacterium]|nr:Stp1/IreP family PP2C-type Ser/Thr phosphatase [Candidatus Binatia bacterium]
MRTSLHLRAAAGTHPGQVYQLNQDKVFAAIRPSERGKMGGLFIVADGMGGHQAGEVASDLAVQTVRDELAWFLESNETEDTQPSASGATTVLDAAAELPLQRRLRMAIEKANQSIAGYSHDNPDEAGNLGTTITCALIDDEVAIVGNVGDSRTYLLRNGELEQLTEDHSYVAQLVRDGQLAPQDVFTHPRRNVITRSLGHRPDVEVDLQVHPLQEGDRLLLCSDGLWEMVQESGAIAEMLGSSDNPKSTVEQLIIAANRAGGADNIGVV